ANCMIKRAKVINWVCDCVDWLVIMRQSTLQMVLTRCPAITPGNGEVVMPRAIDFHVHLPTTEFMQVTLGPYAQAAERYFRTEVKLKDIEQIAADYAELDMIGVLLAWDAETATGLPPLGNDYIAAIVQRYPKQFIGFASVDPHKGRAAVKEMERAIKDLGLAGAKFH